MTLSPDDPLAKSARAALVIAYADACCDNLLATVYVDAFRLEKLPKKEGDELIATAKVIYLAKPEVCADMRHRIDSGLVYR